MEAAIGTSFDETAIFVYNDGDCQNRYINIGASDPEAVRGEELQYAIGRTVSPDGARYKFLSTNPTVQLLECVPLARDIFYFLTNESF